MASFAAADLAAAAGADPAALTKSDVPSVDGGGKKSQWDDTH